MSHAVDQEVSDSSGRMMWLKDVNPLIDNVFSWLEIVIVNEILFMELLGLFLKKIISSLKWNILLSLCMKYLFERSAISSIIL